MAHEHFCIINMIMCTTVDCHCLYLNIHINSNNTQVHEKHIIVYEINIYLTNSLIVYANKDDDDSFHSTSNINTQHVFNRFSLNEFEYENGKMV